MIKYMLALGVVSAALVAGVFTAKSNAAVTATMNAQVGHVQAPTNADALRVGGISLVSSMRPTWNPGRSLCATAVTSAAFALGYWTLSKFAWAGTWLAGRFISGGLVRQMVGWFSWGEVYTLAYNYVCW